MFTVNTKELTSPVREIKKSAVEAAQRNKMRSVSRNLVEEIICDVFDTGYCADAEGVKKLSFSFVENVIMETFNRGALNEARTQCFNRWSPSDVFVSVLVKQVINDSSFITPVAVLVRQCILNTVEEVLK